GDKYLHYYNYSAASRWAANWSITPTPTGVTNTNSDAESGQVLPTGSTFRMTFRVRINSTGGGSPVIAMFYGTTSGRNSITDNETKTPNEILKTGLTASDEWQDIEVYFTTPDEYLTLTKGVANRFYTGIISGNSSKGYKLDYDLDYIKIEKVTNVNFYVKEDGKYVLKESLEGCPGETLDLPDAYSVENYSPYDPTGNYTMMAYKNWFADENLTSVPTLKFGNLDQNLYCGGATEMPEVSVDNQEIFVGFDTYTQRTDGLVNATVTDSDAYTGSASLKAEGNALFELKNDHALDVENGKTYRVDFAYKADKNATLFMGLAEGSVENGIVNKGYTDLTATDDWRSASIVFTADGALENSVLGGSVSTADDANVFIDTVIVSSATESVGVEAETADDGEALRFMLTYSGNDLVMAGENYTVTEHGVLVKGAELDTELSLDNADEAGIFAFSQTDVSQNWSVNPITGATVYSAYLSGFDKADDYEVSVRGYVKLTDGTVYYSDILTASVADIPAARDIIPEDADLSAYYVFLPEGTTLPADKDYTVTTYDDTFKANNAVEGNLITKDSYVLFSARPDFSKIDVPSELKYLVHGGTKDELYYGIEAQVVSEKISEVGSETVNYLFITDIHFSSTDRTSLLKQAALMAKMANENDDIDFIVIGGDTTTGMSDSKEACVTATQTALDPFLASTKPVFVLMGNHDDNSYHLLSGSNTNDEL
ncbi:MAG: metallophosphoesterase, partial [Clostridia bacterium]|nr:metallophosphoesterase [Clostridia bacterium]